MAKIWPHVTQCICIIGHGNCPILTDMGGLIFILMIYLLFGRHVVYVTGQLFSLYMFSFKYFFQDNSVVVNVHQLTAYGKCFFHIVCLPREIRILCICRYCYTHYSL